jgi:predicted metal-binding protein
MRFSWFREVNRRVLNLEKEVFLSGFYKAFAFPPAPCNLCGRCQESKRECRQPLASRPTLEAFCVDVFATARKMGYEIQVLKGYEEEMNRFGLLLIE